METPAGVSPESSKSFDTRTAEGGVRPLQQMIDSLFLASTNHLLAQSGWARTRLQPHAGKRATLELSPLAVSFSVSADGHLASCSSDSEPDVMLQVPLAESARIIGGGMEALMSQVRITGNADFADALGFVFRHLRWDLEEDLSRVVGDIAAHRLVDTGVALGRAHKRMVSNLSGNLVEYLTEERPLLTPRALIPAFDDELRTLRDSVARLEKRIDRLGARKPRR